MSNLPINPSYKVIADHLRCVAFLIADGVLPANEGRGYVLRRIMRRAMLHVNKLSSKKEALIYKLIPSLIKEMGDAYPEIIRAKDLICDTLKNEEERFRVTIDNGLEILEEELLKLKKGQKFPGEIAFKLYDTYGFPLDLTGNVLKEKNIEVDVAVFESEMELQKKRAKENWSGSGSKKDDDIYFDLKEKLSDTKFLGYENTKANAKILAILKDGKEVQKALKGCEIILDQTPFYATSGGQRGDDGNIILASQNNKAQSLSYKDIKNIIDIDEVQKYAGNLFIHPVSDIKGEFKVGDEVIALVNNRNRQFRAQNHSATHLLHFALKKVLGNQVTQKGSDVRSHHFTFDFNHSKNLTTEELDLIEDLVNFYIRQNSKVKTEILPIEDARKKGAVALFGEKYDDTVRVLFMAEDKNNENLSIELCGGTHVKRTGNIGLFKIISEKGIAAGIRRIEAKTGYFALQHLQSQEQKLRALLESLKIKQQFNEIKIADSEFYHAKCGFDDLSYFADEVSNKQITGIKEREAINDAVAKTYQLGSERLNEIKKKDKEIEKLKKEKIAGDNSNFTLENIAGINLTHHFFDGMEGKEVRNLITEIKNKKEYKNNSIIIFFGYFENKVSVAIAISSDLADKFNASKLIPAIVEKIGGKGGGGKSDFAMGGGVNKDGINGAIAVLKELLTSLC